MNGPEENKWLAAVRADPQHSKNFAQRWRTLEAEGHDIYGEARMVDAMAERGSRILDAGCGTGRIGGWLAGIGHSVVGVDLDPHLIEVAQQEHPSARWVVGNLADFTLPQTGGAPQEFDLIVSAGNVVTFLSAAERIPSLKRLHDVLATQGRLMVGFGAGRGYEFEQFRQDAAEAGLRIQGEYSTWQLHEPNDEFLVAVLSRA
ncbi:class I SAM-dependent methyltransferase [Glutamicibacter sp.]|uniref:class I SAM-dependent DNA methyltransferase n=1 Tax=Glutamicibacter sp. TaxID=1931995 RepID=UPI0028BDDCA2|nr:class I SAM-dependent methyltransferase [Glutamicibacter sp.]